MITNLFSLFNLFKKKPQPAAALPAMRREQLVPRIRHVSFIQKLQEHGMPEDQLPVTTPLCGELLVTYAFDLPEQFIMASPMFLNNAGIAVSEVPALALRNLAQQMPKPRQSRMQGCTLVSTGEQLEATLLLLDAFWQEMQQASPGGSIVAVVPHRDRLLLCDGRDAQALEQLDRQAQAFLSEEPQNHALSLQKMLRRDGRWQLFEAH